MKKNSLAHGAAFILLLGSVVSCTPTKKALDIPDEEQAVFDSTEEEQVEIQHDGTEYEIIIIEPGFFTWLNSIARPEGHYSQSFMENRNNLYVMEWNRRVSEPFRFDPNLYQFQIDYSPTIDYGYEVNYKLYNYFIYFQRKYDQRLGPFIPRI